MNIMRGLIGTLLAVFIAVLFQRAVCIQPRDPQTARLTTFGAAPNTGNNKPNNTQPVITGKMCRTESDCGSLPNTTCMTDPRDKKMRCLCADKSVPVHGTCHTKKRPLHTSCSSDMDCIDGAECTMNNSTMSANKSQEKVCLCKMGFEEEDMECNRGIPSTLPVSYLLLLAAYPAFYLVLH